MKSLRELGAFDPLPPHSNYRLTNVQRIENLENGIVDLRGQLSEVAVIVEAIHRIVRSRE